VNPTIPANATYFLDVVNGTAAPPSEAELAILVQAMNQLATEVAAGAIGTIPPCELVVFEPVGEFLI
jgi:hypothetical protein